MDNVIVTYQILKADHASELVLHTFNNTFPSGVAVLNDVYKPPICRIDWAGLFAKNLEVPPEVGLRLIEESHDPEYNRGDCAVYAPWATPEIGLDLIDRAGDPYYWCLEAAEHAHWMTPEIKTKLLNGA